MKRFSLVAAILALIFMVCLTVGCVANTTEKATLEKTTLENTQIGQTTESKTANENKAVSENKPDTVKNNTKETDTKEKTKADKSAQPEPPTHNQVNKPTAGPTATLWVTKDFAKQQIAVKQVQAQNTVMDILQQNLTVETQYGGGFVNSINGLASGYIGADKKKRDWFYYMNGIMTSVGAQDYRAAAGDVIWWDYHDWGASQFTPAVIGAFPRPFVNGYMGKNPGTRVLATAGYEQQGEKLAQHLRNQGVKVEVKPYSADLLATDQAMTLVVGLWSQLAQDSYLQGIQKQRRKTGLFVELTPQYFAALNIQGEEAKRYQANTGAIVATGTGMGDTTPLWLVTGVDKAGLDSAINILTNSPGQIKHHFGAIVTGGQVVAVPIIN